MDNSTVVLSPAYREATRLALLIQIPIAIICMSVLDGGALARVCGIAMLSFWIVAAAVAVRRPWSPTKADLWYWRWGFLPCLALAIFLWSWR